MAGKVQMVPFRNTTEKSIELRCSVTPGNSDQAFDFPPGKVVKAPAGYLKWFKRHGIVRASDVEAKAESDKAEGKAEKAEKPKESSGK